MKLLGKIALGPANNTVGLYGLAIAPEHNRLYCSNLHTPNLTMIDLATRRFTGITPLETREQRGLMELTRNPATGRLYISNELKNCLYVVDPATNKVQVVETGRAPRYVDFDPRTKRIFVACTGDNAVQALDANHKTVATAPVGRAPWGIAVDAARRRLYVVCQEDRALWRLDLDTLRPIGSPAPLGVEPRCVAVDPVDGKVLVAQRRERHMLVLDAHTFRVLAKPETEWDAIGITLDARYRRIYVVNRMGKLEEEVGQPGTISVIDAEHLHTLRHVPVGKIPHYLALDEKHAYVGGEDSLDVTVLDRESMQPAARIRGLGQTIDGMEIHRRTGHIYVPSHLTDDVIVADPEKGRTIARPAVGSWPSGVGINSRTGLIYCTDMDPGSVTVLRDSDHTKVATIDLGVGINKIHRLWSRVAVDEVRNRIYVTLVRFHGVAAIDGASGKVAYRVKLGADNADVQSDYVRAYELSVSVDPVSNRVYVMNGHKSQLHVIDAEGGKKIATVDLSSLELPLERRFSLFGVATAHPSRKRFYAYNWIVSTETHRVIGRIPPEHGTGVTAVDEERNHLYMHGVRGMTIVDAESLQKIDFLPLEAEPGGEPSEVRTIYGVDVARRRVYAARHLMMLGNELEAYAV